jgi:integrase/recombinase XerD
MKLHDVIAEYVALRKAIGYRFTTCEHRLKSFSRAAGAGIDMQDVDPTHVLCFLGKPTTTYWHHKYSTLSGFYRYAISRGHVAASPLPTSVPKLPPRFVPYIYTHDEVRRLLDATPYYRKTHLLLEPYTLRAVLLLLYGAALRISEALSLTLADVDLTEGLLEIRETKFFKARCVPICPPLTQAMTRYAQRRRAAGHSDAPEASFFLGRTGCSLEIPTVQQAFRSLRAYIGLHRTDGARYEPRLHDLRHAAAVNRLVSWYQAGANVQTLLPKLSTYLGHACLNSTQVYLTMTPELLHEASVRFEQYALNGGRHE